MFGKKIQNNGRVTTVTYYVPDRFAVQAASLGMATNTFSPMSSGTSAGGASARGPMGLPGYGMNRFAGERAYQRGTKQDLGAPVAPVLYPRSRRLGLGSGVAGQPGMPSTGADTSGFGAIA